MVVGSFLGLALTGMTLKFSYAAWATVLARLLGGFEAAGLIHRFCAVVTFTYFGLHLWDLARQKKTSGGSWRKLIFGPESMMLNRRDWREFVGSVKWFLKKGPRPQYGRWTYWEKFDYFAVFWGVAVIGMTGLILWFPTVFTHVMPGWMVNVATTIHSDEALLAVCFIFSIHFFNTHFRPEKFPIDTVIFTGGVPLEDLKQDRPREYQQLVESGRLEQVMMSAPDATGKPDVAEVRLHGARDRALPDRAHPVCDDVRVSVIGKREARQPRDQQRRPGLAVRSLAMEERIRQGFWPISA